MIINGKEINLRKNFDEVIDTLAQHVKEQRVRRFKSEEEYAQEIGISRNTLRNLEKGKGTIETLLKFVYYIEEEEEFLKSIKLVGNTREEWNKEAEKYNLNKI